MKHGRNNYFLGRVIFCNFYLYMSYICYIFTETNLKHTIMKTYTEKEVKDILTSVFVFSGANENQGLSKITGKNYDEKIQTVLKSNNTSGNGCIIEAINKFTK